MAVALADAFAVPTVRTPASRCSAGWRGSRSGSRTQMISLFRAVFPAIKYQISNDYSVAEP